jgi:N-acetylmuramoyl-L-alanine amidase
MLESNIIKRFLFLLMVCCLGPIHLWAQKAEQPYRMKTVVIDPGHGGNDPGNLGTGRYKHKEKDISLDIALRVGGYIKESFPEIKVIYTRDKDVFIGLNERADVANKADADLFLSIHCNAAKNPEAMGVETFALGLHRNDENLAVAMKENQAIFLEDDYQTKYEGFDPSSPESIIALTIMQSAFLEQSLKISSYIQQQFKERVGRKDRGVKQAGFLVLRRTTMPSILIELGFLTNKQEEDFLNSEEGKSFMASAIFRGFKEYKEKVEGAATSVKVAESKPQVEVKKEELVKTETTAPKPVETPKVQEEDEKAKKQRELAAAKAEKERLEKLKAEQTAAAEKKALEEKRRIEAAERLAKEKAALEQELEAAKRKAEADEKARLADQVHREAVAEQARKEFAERLAQRERAKQDSLQRVHADQRQRKEEEAKKPDVPIVQESRPEKKVVVDALSDRPLSADEAELLFLEKRKQELEDRINRMKTKESQAAGVPEQPKEQPKEQPTKKIVDQEQQLASKPQPHNNVDKGVSLSVQILSSATAIDVNSPRLKGELPSHYLHDGQYKYVVGKFTNMESATAEQARLRKIGFDGAFVVAFKDGERITVAEARELLK